MGVKYACDFSNRLIDEFSPIGLNDLSCAVCVNICESTDLCRDLFVVVVVIVVGAERLQSQRVPIVAIPFFSASLLGLVPCQLVATVIGCSEKGHDPADGSIVSV